MHDAATANENGRIPAEHRRPPCRLVGSDGNVFAIIGRVQRALREVGEAAAAKEFVARAIQSKLYDEVLALCLEYVDVS